MLFFAEKRIKFDEFKKKESYSKEQRNTTLSTTLNSKKSLEQSEQRFRFIFYLHNNNGHDTRTESPV